MSHWNLYRILDEQHQQQDIPPQQAAWLFDPVEASVQAGDAALKPKSCLVAPKDGRDVASVRFEDHPGLRFCFESGPPEKKVSTERATRVLAHLRSMQNGFGADIQFSECYELGHTLKLHFRWKGPGQDTNPICLDAEGYTRVCLSLAADDDDLTQGAVNEVVRELDGSDSEDEWDDA